MKSKSLILLTALAMLIAIRYGIGSWVQPTLQSYASHDGGFSFAGGLLSIFDRLSMMLGVGALAVLVLIARSVADAFAAGRNVRRSA